MPKTSRIMLTMYDHLTRPDPPAMKRAAPIHATHIHQVRAAFTDPNIVGIGIGNKVTSGVDTGVLCISFFVIRKIALNRLRSAYAIPPVLAGIDGRALFTDVVVTGQFVPSAAPLAQQSPIQSGFSVGSSTETGTLGAIVQRDGKNYLLSAAHVIAPNGSSDIDTQIDYPGPDDTGSQWVATLSDVTDFMQGGALVNDMDAALAEVLPSRLADLNSVIPGASLPMTVGTPHQGMTVRLRGRTSGDTTGTIMHIPISPLVDYGGGIGIVGFRGQVLCTPFTRAGDSGALVVEDATGDILGLHFAIAEGGSVFTPIQTILDALGISFATA